MDTNGGAKPSFYLNQVFDILNHLLKRDENKN